MNTNPRQQEILLMIHSHFFSKKWLKINERENDNKLSGKEQLKEACWNGLTPEILPECFETTYDKSTRLWEINDADAFIDLEYGEHIFNKEKAYSVNPYTFMQVQGFN